MKDESKTKKQLISELISLRQQLKKQEDNKRTEPSDIKKLLLSPAFIQFLEDMPCAALLADIDGEIFFANKKKLSMQGFESPEEYLSANPIDMVAPQDRHNVYKDLDKLYSAGSVSNKIYKMKRKDGTEYYEEMNASILKSPDGFPAAVIIFSADVTERKETEKNLLENEQRYRFLVESLNEGIWKVDAEGYTTYVNEKTAEILGCTRDELYGKHFMEFVKKNETGKAENLFSKLKEGLKLNTVYDLVKKDGICITISASVSPVFDDEGNFKGTLGSILDITDKRRTQMALERSERLLRRVIENIPLGIWAAGKDYKVLLWNKMQEIMTGISREEIFGKNIFLRLPSLKENGLEKLFRQVQETGNPLSLTNYPYFDPALKETEFFLNIKAIPLFDIDGKPEGLIAAIEDISEQKYEEQSIKESSEKFRTLIENLTVGILYIDPAGKILEVNRSMVEMLGSPSFEATKSINCLSFKPIVDSGIAKDIRNCITAGRIVRNERFYESKWGRKLYLKYSMAPIKDFHNHLIGILGSVEDITSYKERENSIFKTNYMLEQELEEVSSALEKATELLNEKTRINDSLQKKLEAGEAVKKKLFSVLSKDLSHPLRSLLIVSNLLTKYGVVLDSDALQVKFSQLKNTSAYLSDMMENLIRWSEWQLGFKDINPEKVNVKSFISEIVTSYGQEAAIKNIKILNKLNESIYAIFDKKTIDNVIRNLISNALKFSNKNGIIEITCKIENSYACITVSDNGTGIEEEKLKKIFDFTAYEENISEDNEILKQVQNDNCRNSSAGAKLGLTLAKEFVEANSGKISVLSHPGKGSSFTFTLPMKKFVV